MQQTANCSEGIEGESLKRLVWLSQQNKYLNDWVDIKKVIATAKKATMKAACAGTRSVRLQNSEAGVPKRQPKEDTNQKCYISRISFPIIFSRPTSELVSQIDSGPVRNQESRLLKSKKTLERKNNLLNLLEKEFVTLKLEDLKNKNRKAESPKRKILHRAYPSSISLRKPSEERLKSHDDFKKSDTSNESIQQFRKLIDSYQRKHSAAQLPRIRANSPLQRG